jgi:hypothetical protein
MLRNTFEFGLTPDDFRAVRAGPWRPFFSI